MATGDVARGKEVAQCARDGVGGATAVEKVAGDGIGEESTQRGGNLGVGEKFANGGGRDGVGPTERAGDGGG